MSSTMLLNRLSNSLQQPKGSLALLCWNRSFTAVKSTVAEKVANPPIDRTGGEERTKYKSHSMFPWRERIPRRSSFFNKIGFEFLRKVLFPFGIKDTAANDSEILTGAVAAMQMTQSSIFQHRLIMNVLVDEPPATDSKSFELVRNVEKQKEIVNLDDIFESKLAGFYEHALLKFSLTNGYELGYSLQSIDSSRIVHREFIIGSHRHSTNIYHDDHSSLIKYESSFGFSAVVDVSGPITPDIGIRLMERGETTIRYWVDLDCSGMRCFAPLCMDHHSYCVYCVL